MTNKEFGSDFHWLPSGEFRDLSFDNDFSNQVDQLYFSGRVALFDILQNGIKMHQWKVLYVPTYYCLEVYDFLNSLPIEIKYYEYNPINQQTSSDIPDELENVVLVVNYFGIVTPDFLDWKQTMVIEDLTHDLSKINSSKADFVFGSLRKILPLPVGGFAKSKSKLTSIQKSDFADFVCMQKFSAMFLKYEFLQGNFQDKDAFRKLYIEAEEAFEDLKTVSKLPLQILEYLKTIKIKEIVQRKKENLSLLKSNLKASNLYKLFTHELNSDLACVLHFQSNETRNQFRTHLIEHKIYPMVLWPSQIQDKDKNVEDHLLFVHIDFRYSSEDIQYIATIINEFTKTNEL